MNLETKLKVFAINFALCLSCQKRVVNHDSRLHSFLLNNIEQHLKMLQNDSNYNGNCDTFDYMLEDVENYDLRANTR